MSNLFDILKFRQEKSIQDRSGHTQAKDNNVIVHDRLSKSESLDATESVGVHDRRKRRSTSSENAEVTIEDEAVQGDQRDHHGDDKVFELESLKQFTIPKKKKSKKGNDLHVDYDLLFNVSMLLTCTDVLLFFNWTVFKIHIIVFIASFGLLILHLY